MTMTYQLATLKSPQQDFPVLFYSEMDAERWEWRKVDVYPDGTLDFADDSGGTGETFLGLQEIPTLDQINEQGEYEAREITSEEFEEIWQKALATGKVPKPMVEYLPVVNDRPRLKDRQSPPA